MNAPEVWWSPSLAEDLSQGGLIERTGPDLWHQEHGTWHRLDELPADAVRLVPATLNSELKVGAFPDTAGRCGDIGDLLFNKRYCCELRAGHAGWHREGVTEWSGVVAHRAASEVPDTGQADEVLKLRWEVQQLQGVVQDQHRAIAAVRSLCADAMKLPTLEDPRPADDRVSPRAVLAALDRAGPSPDTVQTPDVAALAYARSEVDKWLASNDPYCILPTRTEHIPALLGRLDELEGTR